MTISQYETTLADAPSPHSPHDELKYGEDPKVPEQR